MFSSNVQSVDLLSVIFVWSNYYLIPYFLWVWVGTKLRISKKQKKKLFQTILPQNGPENIYKNLKPWERHYKFILSFFTSCNSLPFLCVFAEINVQRNMWWVELNHTGNKGGMTSVGSEWVVYVKSVSFPSGSHSLPSSFLPRLWRQSTH